MPKSIAKFFFVLYFSNFCPIFGQTAVDSMEGELRKCIELAESQEKSSDICYKTALRKLDLRLNTLYQSIYSNLPKKDKLNFKNAQRKWLSFRDADAVFRKQFDEDFALEFAYQELRGRVMDLECIITNNHWD